MLDKKQRLIVETVKMTEAITIEYDAGSGETIRLRVADKCVKHQIALALQQGYLDRNRKQLKTMQYGRQ